MTKSNRQFRPLPSRGPFPLITFILLLSIFSGFAQALVLSVPALEKPNTESVSHQIITRMALNNIVQEYWTNQPRTKAMFRSREQIVFSAGAEPGYEQIRWWPRIHRGLPLLPMNLPGKSQELGLRRLLAALEVNALREARFHLGNTLREIQGRYKEDTWEELDRYARREHPVTIPGASFERIYLIISRG